ncbi:hypothetical protein CC1G_14753 [Coprinopsis cinerea okayama7|uniref:Uncharacterized protein n=1 Tax=Coprinopsis cinerea (strain Okayama-7 / 130 / ATCC MYA-4618 / FGSC 9003) TaxID=240176 RepID=D6RNL6_COPC7|nr:hypothetical protein CC1G_14753 [Coprinopsis cinerea okayama7\|eukprot:XP_002910775.1 hypothetical protein CC1G_14753 [Coprinopsis cinerea okayama7\
MKKIAALHEISLGRRNRANIESVLFDHDCAECPRYVTSLEIVPGKRLVKRQLNKRRSGKTRFPVHLPDDNITDKDDIKFPPLPLDDLATERIIRGACAKLSPSVFEESGCAVCGILHSTKSMLPISSIRNLLHVLESPGVTRKERRNTNEAIESCKGPVLDRKCDKSSLVCVTQNASWLQEFDTLENLESYPEDAPPVAVEYVHSTTNKSPENSSLFDKDEEDGTAEGDSSEQTG